MARRIIFNPLTGKFDYMDDTDTVAVWGQITGTLSDQTDLQAALDAKAATVHTHTLSQITNAGDLAALDDLSTFDTDDLAEGSNLYYTQARFNTAFAAKSTTDLSEGTNLYFTDERAQDAVGNSVGTGLDYDDTTGAISVDLSELDHGSLGGLTDDDHTQYALLAGRSGGQTLIGGTASGDDLTLLSTSHATPGNISLGTSANPASSLLVFTINESKLTRTTSSTASLVGNYRLSLLSSGTVANGFGNVIAFNMEDAAGAEITNTGYLGSIWENASSDQIAGLVFYTKPSGGSATEKLRISGSGNVGIGVTSFGTDATKALAIGNGIAPTTAPTDMTQLYSADYAAGDARLFVKGESGNVVSIGNGTITGGTASGDDLTLQSTSNATKGTIFLGANSAYDEANGRLGIGTTTPSFKIHSVTDGEVNFFGMDTYGTTGSDFFPLLQTRLARGTLALPTALASGDLLYDFRVQGYEGDEYKNVTIIRSTVDAAVSNNIVPGRLQFFTAAASTGTITERMRIDSSGNLGLGATSFGTSAAKVFAIANGTAPSTAPADMVQIYAADYAAGDSRLFLRGESGNIMSLGNGTLTGGTASGEDLTLQSTSNATKGTIFLGANSAYDEVNTRLGIGTTSPSRAIDIQGTLSGSSDPLRVNHKNSAADGFTDYFQFNDQNKFNGFQIGGSTVTGTQFGISQANLAKFISSADVFAIGTSVASPLVFGTNNAERVRILSTGEVGIGTLTPVGKLDIVTAATNDDPTLSFRQARVATTNATVTTLQTIAITASNTYLLEARVVARRTGGTAGTADDGAVYIRRAMVTTKAGTVTINAVQDGLTQEDQAGWDCTFTVSGTNILLEVTGAANNNITWHTTTLVQLLGS